MSSWMCKSQVLVFVSFLKIIFFLKNVFSIKILNSILLEKENRKYVISAHRSSIVLRKNEKQTNKINLYFVCIKLHENIFLKLKLKLKLNYAFFLQHFLLIVLDFYFSLESTFLAEGRRRFFSFFISASALPKKWQHFISFVWCFGAVLSSFFHTNQHLPFYCFFIERP